MKIILILLPLAIFFSACDKDRKYKHYIYTDVGAVAFESASPSPDPIPASESVPYDKFVLRLEFEHFMTQESDFSSYEYEPICDDPITSILIKSINDYKPSKPAGTPITDCFYYKAGSETQQSLDYIRIKNYTSEEYWLRPFPVFFDMFIKIPPAENSSHRFIVEATTTGGETWIDTTKSVIILN